MNRLKSIIGTIIAVLYFIFPMGLALLVLIFTPLMFLSDVSSIRTSGFAGPRSELAVIGVCGLIIGLSMLIPALRRIYTFFPWMYAFIKIFFINMIILNVALTILNYGYEVQDESRHTLFFILMISQLIICRLGMSLYFKLRPVKSSGGS